VSRPILPPRRERPVRFKLPRLQTAPDAVGALAALTDAVATAEITPGEAAEFVKLVEAFVRALEASELDRRLRNIEEWKDLGNGSRSGKEG
jgi:hypothetical protein